MRILFVTPYPVSRIRTRSYGFVTQLAQLHKIRVLALCAGERDMADMRELQNQGIEIIAIEEKPRQQYLRSLRTLSTELPLQVAFGASPALQAEIRKQLASGQFDLVHVECIRALEALPDHLPVPVVWDAVDCVTNLYEMGARFGATTMMRLIGSNETRRVRAYERQQLQRFRHILVISERDRQGLLKLSESDVEKAGNAEITVLAHGIDQTYFHRQDSTRQPETLIFSGKMSFHANVAGVLHLVKHIMPLIWQRRPQVRLIIAGSAPPAAVRRLARDPRITVTGYVPDLRPYIAQAQVSVSPLPYAVGIQNKVLEAMAIGTPVVTSSCSLAGMQAIAGHDLLVADQPEAFADAVLSLLEDRSLWNRISEQGWQYITNQHNWEEIIQRLSSIYADAVANAMIKQA
ncbi:MAG TPA: glycosyltransferase [Ktedonosporobacter sp.]|nr:glycosyltransferase [Ktedonosporobacter sp.]